MTSFTDYFATHSIQYIKMVYQHLYISFSAVLLACLIAIPLGILCTKNHYLDIVITRLMNSLRVIPSLAILFVCVPLVGTGLIPALVALLVLAIPPILINTVLGFQSVDPAIIEAATGMGMDARYLFFHIKCPLALPVIFSGIRTATIEVIASATLASYIGGGGLGDLIFTGLGLMRTDLLWIGGLSVALLSLISSYLLSLVDHRLRYYEKGN